MDTEMDHVIATLDFFNMHPPALLGTERPPVLFSVLKDTVMFLPSKYHSFGTPENAAVLSAVMHTARDNRYVDQAAKLFHEFCKQAPSAYDAPAIDAAISSLSSSPPPPSAPTFGALRYWAKIAYVERLISLIPAEQRATNEGVVMCLAALHTTDYMAARSNNNTPKNKNHNTASATTTTTTTTTVWRDMFMGPLCNGSLDAFMAALKDRDVKYHDLDTLFKAAEAADTEGANHIVTQYPHYNDKNKKLSLERTPLPAPTLHDVTFEWGTERAIKYNIVDGIMPPTLDAAIQVIVAGMGVGKTVAVVDFIARLPPTASVLFITHSRVLANKLAKQFGIVNYQLLPKGTPIKDSRVVCCLDSLPRIKTNAFDLVVMDEALSVLHHFHSKVMENKPSVCGTFNTIMCHSARVLLMDAFGDNQLVRRFVAALATERARPRAAHSRDMYFPNDTAIEQEPLWTLNTWVREPNTTKFHVHINNSGMQPGEFKRMFLDAVLHFLQQGKRVVVPTSNKSLVDDLDELLVKAMPEVHARSYFYTKSTDKAIMRAHFENVDEAWKDRDFIAYSPCVGPGVSFELKGHFHVVVAYFENSAGTPMVNTCMQQLFRVRDVADRTYHVFMNTTYREPAPVHASAVERALVLEDNYLQGLDMAATPFTTDGHFHSRVYKKDNLFYPNLVGMLVNRGMSFALFEDIMVDFLKRDRGGIVEITKHFVPTDRAKKRARQAPNSAAVAAAADTTTNDDAVNNAKKPKTDENIDGTNTDGAAAAIPDRDGFPAREPPPMPKKLVSYAIVSQQTWVELRRMHREGAAMTPEEEQELHNYDIAVDGYGIAPERVDEAFLEKYVGSVADPADVERATDALHRFKAFATLMHKGLPATVDELNGHLNNHKRPTHMLDMYGKRPLQLDKLALEAALMMQAVFTEAQLAELRQAPGHMFTEPICDVHERLAAYVAAMEPCREKEMVKQLGIARRDKDNCWSKKAMTNLLKMAFKKGLAVHSGSDKRSVTTTVSAAEFYGLVERYDPRRFVMGPAPAPAIAAAPAALPPGASSSPA